MGVRGLQTFLKENIELLAQKILIADTSIVIDANNISCSLYSRTCIDRQSEQHRADVYGGDLVMFAKLIKDFFASLDKCHITPILVFDGSVIGREELKEFVATKEKSVRQRAVERFEQTTKLTEFPPDDNNMVMSQIISLVFRNITSDLGIQCVQSPYEADSHIARIANDLNCPVLTNDSDFIIYALKVGFVMFDLMKYNDLVNEDGKSYIPCLMFSQDQLVKVLPGLQRENMALLSVLLGNDYIEAGAFDRIMRALFSHLDSGIFQTRSFSHRKIAHLLTWMRRRRLQDCIDTILSVVLDVYRPRLEASIKMFLRNYRIEEVDDLEAELLRVYPDTKVDPSNPSETQPVSYLRTLFEHDGLGSACLDMIFKNVHYNYNVVDDLTFACSNSVKYRLYSVFLALIRSKSYLGLTPSEEQTQRRQDSFTIYDRVAHGYDELIIRPMEVLDDFGSMRHCNLYEVVALDTNLKKSILMTTLRFNNEVSSLIKDTLSKVFVEKYVDEACLCMILVRYIGLEMRQEPKPQFVDALLLTIFYYAAIEQKLTQAALSGSAYGGLLLKLRPYVCKKKLDPACADAHLFRRIVHFISQLQAAYKGYALLNTLLKHVYIKPRPEMYFNSTLIYSLTKLMRVNGESSNNICMDLPILSETLLTVKAIVHCAE